jgi:hypothetical protein
MAVIDQSYRSSGSPKREPSSRMRPTILPFRRPMTGLVLKRG